MSDYTSSLAVDCSVEVGGGTSSFSMGFSASVAANQFAQDVVNSKSERYQMTSYCVQYVTGLQPRDCDIPPEDHFKNWALTLPKVVKNFGDGESDEAKQWFAFFEEFGTHCEYLIISMSIPLSLAARLSSTYTHMYVLLLFHIFRSYQQVAPWWKDDLRDDFHSGERRFHPQQRS